MPHVRARYKELTENPGASRAITHARARCAECVGSEGWGCPQPSFRYFSSSCIVRWFSVSAFHSTSKSCN